MIPDIKELDFPEKDGVRYATLTSATVNLTDMGEKTITSQVKIDGNITPDFSRDWSVEFRGEKFIMPLRKPQGAKGNTPLDSTIDLTFQHWAVYQLKRHYFFTVQSVATDTYIPDRYIASVSLNLADFHTLFNRVLQYYYGDAIRMKIADEWQEKLSADAVNIEINHSKIWDVLIKLYGLYGVRWRIEPDGDIGHYIINVGATENEIDHIFEYGFTGGLLNVERQVQDENICNKLIGRGGSKNLPYRYFKDVDPSNPYFPADPDWIPELRNVPFTELRSKEFRDYVRGWKCNPRRQLTDENGPIYPYGSSTPIAVETIDNGDYFSNWAYAKGCDDAKFDPPEYVKDDESIARYGELENHLENNEEIYPSIQGRSINGLGRVNEIVDIEQAEDTVIVESASNDAITIDVGVKNDGKTTTSIDASTITDSQASIVIVTIPGNEFVVPDGKKAIFDVKDVSASVEYVYQGQYIPLKPVAVAAEESAYELVKYAVRVYDSTGKQVSSPSGFSGGVYTYSLEVSVRLKNISTRGGTLNVTAAHAGGVLTYATVSDDALKGRTFKVWIKNIWNSVRWGGETDKFYAERVWRQILGDSEGNEAKVVFSDGMLGISEDYEFKIVKDGIVFDDSRSIVVGDTTVKSHWCLTLEKSDADLESTGLYVPSKMRNGNPGDHFFFTGIELPHYYVLWAEQALQDYKLTELGKVKDIMPTWVVSADRVRLNERGEDGRKLIDQLTPGASVRLADKRFILNDDGTPAAYETLYLQSVTLTYREPTSDDAALNPDVEVVLSDSYATTASPVATLQGSVDALSRQLGSLGNIEQIIRAVGDKLYLRKDGIFDRSVSPTEFANLLTSYGFRQGMIGGAGWGFYRDANGNWVLETDRIKARQDFEVSNLVVSQITARGGMIVESAAALEITAVEKDTSGNYRCYFDQKGGSIKNLFVKDDIALCHRFDPGTTSTPAVAGASSAYEKFYKRRVVDVAESYVTLKNEYRESEVLPTAVTPPGDWGIMDFGVNGSGIPAEGDVIVQYGNYTDKNRQYVIVRDVVGGGYERFIEGLNSVNTNGTEYFFVGKQAGMYGDKARFFLGNERNFIEYINGELNIRAKLNVQSTIGDKPIDSYIQQVAEDAVLTPENMALGTGLEMVVKPHANIKNENVTLYKVTGLAIGDTIKVAFDYVIKDVFSTSTTDQHYGDRKIIVALGRAYGYKNVFVARGADNPDPIHFESESFVLGEGADPSYIEGTTAETVGEIYIITDYCPGGEIVISNMQIVKGEAVPEEWEPSPKDFNATAKAMTGNTTISGGLMLSSVVEVGGWGDRGYVVRAGMSGIDNPQHEHGGVVFWGGGTYEQADAGKSTYAIYMDGTGHAAGGTIKFHENRLQVGDYVNLDKAGLDMVIGGNQKMRMGNYKIDGRFVMLYQLTRDLGDMQLGHLDYRVQISSAGTAQVEGLYPDYLGTQKDYLLKKSYGIGAVPAGSQIKLTGSPLLDIALFNNVATEKATKIGSIHPVVIVYFHRKGATPYLEASTGDFYKRIEIHPKIVTNPATQFFEYDVGAVQWTTEQDYDDVEMSIEVDNYSLRSLTGDYYPGDTTLGSTKQVKFVATMPEENVTEIGANGLRASWGSSNQYQTDGYWGARVGNNGLAIDESGVKIYTSAYGWIYLSEYIKKIVGIA